MDVEIIVGNDDQKSLEERLLEENRRLKKYLKGMTLTKTSLRNKARELRFKLAGVNRNLEYIRSGSLPFEVHVAVINGLMAAEVGSEKLALYNEFMSMPKADLAMGLASATRQIGELEKKVEDLTRQLAADEVELDKKDFGMIRLDSENNLSSTGTQPQVLPAGPQEGLDVVDPLFGDLGLRYRIVD